MKMWWARFVFMKLVVFLIILVAIVWGSVAHKEIRRTSAALSDHRDPEPFAGSQVGKTLLRACGNCHSNQTRMPWYGYVPPISWWIHGHVREGRQELNFSNWRSYSPREQRDELQSICGVIATGRMPPSSYTAMHPEARLDAHEKKAVCAWTAMEIDHGK